LRAKILPEFMKDGRPVGRVPFLRHIVSKPLFNNNAFGIQPPRYYNTTVVVAARRRLWLFKHKVRSAAAAAAALPTPPLLHTAVVTLAHLNC
jgi:hypothetical protein